MHGWSSSSMAESLNMEEIPQNISPSTPFPSIPLQLSGFLNGDTIQVEGETGDLQFSVKFNVQTKHASKDNFHFPHTNSLENIYPCQDSSFCSFTTPNSTHRVEEQSAETEPLMVLENQGTEETAKSDATKRDVIMTRLKSGVMSPVKYFPRAFVNEHGDSRSSSKVKPKKKRRVKREVVLEKMIQRHSFPARPCSSYAFFVVATWGLVESSSFGEASKKLSQMWCKLPRRDKKIYKDMAVKDSARYKRQCMLLKSQDQNAE
ncbi:hypothetical protein SLA2020_387430 [Shorea laevis]